MAYSKQTWKNKKAGGTPINADALNHMEDGIEAASYKVDEICKNLGNLKFGIDGDGNYGYYKADDSFVPFKSSGGTGKYKFNLLKEAAQISTTDGGGAYVKTPIPNILSYSLIAFDIYKLNSDGTKTYTQRQYIEYDSSKLPSYAFTLWHDTTFFDIALTSTSIECTFCSGSWYNYYIDIYAWAEEILPGISIYDLASISCEHDMRSPEHDDHTLLFADSDNTWSNSSVIYTSEIDLTKYATLSFRGHLKTNSQYTYVVLSKYPYAQQWSNRWEPSSNLIKNESNILAYTNVDGDIEWSIDMSDIMETTRLYVILISGIDSLPWSPECNNSLNGTATLTIDDIKLS